MASRPASAGESTEVIHLLDELRSEMQGKRPSRFLLGRNRGRRYRASVSALYGWNIVCSAFRLDFSKREAQDVKVQIKEIPYSAALTIDDPVFIDVRSPGEYVKDHIPGSLNIPLFEDSEREEVGRVYHLLGRDEAIFRGSEFVGKKLGAIVNRFREFKGREIVINCFRGGMRSASLVALLSSLDFDVYKLSNGYKGYRQYVVSSLDGLDSMPQLFVLQGLTGTGKTEIIRRIENAIDLEAMAGHRSSVFGGIGLRQRTQKLFESLLLHRINTLKDEAFAVCEGESRKIGNLHIPKSFMQLINSSPAILITASLDRRIDIILREYTGDIDTREIIPIVRSLESRIGKDTVHQLVELLREGELAAFTGILLKKYYDPLYEHTIKKMSFIAVIDNTETEHACEEVKRTVLDYIASRR